MSTVEDRPSPWRRLSAVSMVFMLLLSTAVVLAAPEEVEARAGIIRSEAGWPVEIVDSEGDVGYSSSMAFDAYGRAHIAYRNDDDATIRYATNSEGAWNITIIDTEVSLDSEVSLDLDSRGNVHISYMSYYDDEYENLIYATNVGGTWTTTVVDPSQFTGYYNDLFVDHNDVVHIAYDNYDLGSLKYANNSAGTWVNETVESTVARIKDCAIVVNEYDIVHIIFRSDGTSSDTLRWAQKYHGVWTRSPLDSNTDTGLSVSMALDGQDIHLSYYDQTAEELLYRYFDGVAWTEPEVVDPTGNSGEYSSIAVGTDGVPHIAYYYSEMSWDLRVASQQDGGWNLTVVDDNGVGTVGEYCSIAVAPNGMIGISYMDGSSSNLLFASQNAWVIEKLAGTTGNRCFGYTDIVLDDDNNAYISYTANADYAVWLATNSGGSWSYDQVDNTTGDYGGTTSIALDDDGKVHVAYYASDSGEIRYASNASGSWVREKVADTRPGWGPNDLSLGLDSNSKAHIAYTFFADSSASASLMYANNVGGSWVNQTVDGHSSSDIGRYPSLVVDPSNKVHISYQNNTNNVLRYATNAGGAWAQSTVDASGNVGDHTSMVMDSTGRLHISYLDYTNKDLKYAFSSGGVWVPATVDTLGWVGEDSSIGVDQSGMVHISYYDTDNSDLKYATNVGGSWTNITLDYKGVVGSENGLAIGTDGKVHISYLDGTNAKIGYATNSPWMFKTVYSLGYVPNEDDDISMVIDANGAHHICFYDRSITGLRYATDAGGSWSTVIVDQDGTSGMHCSIAVDHRGKVHVSYYDANRMDLRYANNTLGTWNAVVVDETGSVGTYSSIAVDANGKAHIGYRDSSNEALKYATNAGGSWVTETVDDIGNVGPYASLALDRNGKAHISYYGGSYSELKYANNIGGSWDSESVEDIVNAVGLYTSLVVDDGIVPHISYYDMTSGNLKYATFTSSAWVTTTVDGSANIRGSYSSLDMDRFGALHISYFDQTNGDLRYATSAGKLWFTTTVDIDGTVGRSSSLAVDQNGVLSICYLDTTDARVKLASQRAEPSAPRGLSAVADEADVDLSWTAPVNFNGYPVLGYYLLRTAPSGLTEKIYQGASLGFSDTDLAEGTYEYSVAAYNLLGIGPFITDVVTVDITELVVPPSPSGLVATAGNGNVTLTWTAPTNDGGSPITGYKVYRGTVPGAEAPLTNLSAVLTYLDQDVDNGDTYYYKVSAVNAIGEGALSTGASATPAGAPSAPQNLTTTLDGNNVSLTWDVPLDDGGSNLTGYKLYRGTASGALSLLDTVGLVLSYQDTTTLANTSYYYHVTALNAIGESSPSNEAASDPNLPSAPYLTVASDGSSVTLTWTMPASQGSSAISAYLVYRGTSAGAETLLTTLGNVLTYVDDDVDAGTTYYYKVTARNAQGEGPFSNEASAAVGSAPSAPQDLEAVAGNATVTLTWEAPADDGGWNVTGYKVYRGTSAGAETLLTTLGDVLTYVDSAVVNGQRYYYRVSAVNDQGEGEQADPVHATPLAEDDGDDDDDEGNGGDSTMLFVILGVVIAGAAAGGAVFFLRKKK